MSIESEFVSSQGNASFRNSTVESPSLAVRIIATIVPFKPTGPADILQGFRPFAGPMDAMGPCLAEAARRLLRTEDTTLIVPQHLMDEALELSLAISDGIPKLIREPTVALGNDDSIQVEGISQLGGEEPSLSVCWVPNHVGHLDLIWSRWVQQIRDLMAAGYPGCVGCGGPGSEGVWDETASRARTRVT